MLKKVKHKFIYGDQKITLETGEIARQTTLSILASMNNTTVLATVVKRQLKERANLIPLSVYYQERTYAVGRIPGSYLRREGRPSEQETLISRLIDRAIRPLFSPPYLYEIQIIVTLLSYNSIIYPDILSIIAVSTALSISFSKNIFYGPIGASRIGLINNLYLLNPTEYAIKNSKLDLLIAGTLRNILMIECHANNIPSYKLLKALKYGHQCQKTVIYNIDIMKEKFYKHIQQEIIIYPTVDSSWYPINIFSLIEKICKSSLIKAYKIKNKNIRNSIINKIKEEILFFFSFNFNKYSNIILYSILEDYIDELEKKILIESIFSSFIRIDGRYNDDIRRLKLKINLFNRLHGSSLFTRGETQALVTVTLGAPRYAQNIEDILGERSENLILHYNFPPYAVNEIGKIISPKRREIGHGRLAKKGLIAVMPKLKTFPYTIRIVSEITSSNGSSSMATVCGASLALMAAGVPIKKAVSGIAMGLIINKDKDQYIILSDILGEEDHLGEIDFKIIGSKNGINALQMDVKTIDILNLKLIKTIILQGKKGIIKIIKRMNKTIRYPKKEISTFAPKIHTINIKQEKIKDIIGKGGIVIRQITEETGAIIDIKDKGVINIIGNNKEQINNAIYKIKEIIEDIYVGKIYPGTVVKLVEFGAFININSKREGLLHISNIKHTRVNKVSDHLRIGQQVLVKVLDINSTGKIRLSMKDVKIYRKSYKK